MEKVQVGDTVKVAYIGTLSDGTQFDNSPEDEDLEITIGNHQVIPGLEQALIDMQVDEKKTVTIPADEAYGRYNEENILVINRNKLSQDIEPQVGLRLEAQNQDGDIIIVTIISMNDETITLDTNHLLAGHDLTFEITLREIIKKEKVPH